MDYLIGLAGSKGTPKVILYVSSKNGLPETEVTWAKILQNQGYKTQAVGEWKKKFEIHSHF